MKNKNQLKKSTLKVFSLLFLLTICSGLNAQNKFTHDETLRKIYTFQYNQKTDSLITFFNHQNPVYREAACLAFASVQNEEVAVHFLFLLMNESQISVRKAIIYSLGQLTSTQASEVLLRWIDKETDTLNQALCLEAVAKTCKVGSKVNSMFKFYQFKTTNKAAVLSYWRALYFAKRNKTIDVEDDTIKTIIDKLGFSTDPRAAAIYRFLYANTNQVEATNFPQDKVKYLSFEDLNNGLKSISSPYLQLDFLKKIECDDNQLLSLAYSNHHSLIKYFVLDTYIKKHWQMVGWNEKINKDFMMYFLRSGDIALISRIAEYVKEQNFAKRQIVVSKESLIDIQKTLVLPRDFETWIDLEKAILSFDGKKYQYQSYFSKGYQNPMDWNFIVKVPQNQKVKITTNKGEIILECKVNEAPASVANFLKLVDSGYYNGKYLHRMVPNFVVQGGCPRGDGWGSLNWNQRSEFSNYLTYQPGSVGLASVGKDSEGVQFFITHTFTQNLDGRYTIFAEVVQGMNIVNQLVVGDIILEIKRIY
jgi:cyclophilin family peptidyl-prolyl cis-trans isomerase